MRTVRTPRPVVALVALALVAAACGSSTDTEAAPSETDATTTTAAPTTTTSVAATDAPTTTADAATAELRAGIEADLQAALDDWIATSGAPGASLSLRLPDGDTIDVTSGLADIVTGEEVTPDSYFRIGSITKTLTAAVVMQLVDEGLIELDAPIRTYLPDWLEGHPHADEITVRQAMDHTNGLPEYAWDPVFYQRAGERLDTPMEPEEVIAYLAEKDPLFAPGEAYNYETGGFVSLGRVIETVTGNSAAAEMRARLFEPLGVDGIFLTPEEFPPEPTVNAYGRELMYAAGTVIIGRADTEGLMIGDEPVVAMNSLPQAVLQSAGWTGGGAEAQVNDVATVFGSLFDGTLLSPEIVAEMSTTVFDANYGLGLSNSTIDGVQVLSHGGGVPGFRSHAAYLPEHDVGFAVSTNLVPLPEGTDVGVLQRAILPIAIDAAAVPAP